MLVCIALQSVAMMPHHHHVDSLAFCIDCIHLCEENACSESDHDTFPDDHEPLACSSQEMILTAPESFAFKAQISCIDHHLHCAHCTCLPCDINTFALLDDCLSSVIFCDHRQNVGSSLYVTHVVSAIPPRAPDFLS